MQASSTVDLGPRPTPGGSRLDGIIGQIRSPIFGVGLILGLALALRLLHLDVDSLWADEVATLGFAELPWSELFGPIARLDPTPPTYYALIKAWTSVAGTSDFALR